MHPNQSGPNYLTDDFKTGVCYSLLTDKSTNSKKYLNGIHLVNQSMEMFIVVVKLLWILNILYWFVLTLHWVTIDKFADILIDFLGGLPQQKGMLAEPIPEVTKFNEF